MKIRNGFVSNSSSSSFIVACKNGECVTAEKILKAFKVDPKSPLYGIAKECAELFVSEEEKTTAELLEYWGYDDVKDLPKEDQKALEFGNGKCISGSFCDDEVGSRLCYAQWV